MVRYLRVLAGSLLILSAVAVSAAAEATTPPNVCTTDGVFCTSFEYAISDATSGLTTTVAATPVNLSLAVSNTSPTVATDMTTWWQTLALNLGNTVTGAPVVATSAQMPANLIVAGTLGGVSTCAYPFTGTNCPAGWGTARVNLSNLPIGNGIYTGSFGIVDIHNDKAAASSAHPLALMVDLKIHIDASGIFPGYDTTINEAITPLVSSSGGGIVLHSLTIPVRQQGSASVASFTANYDASLESIHLSFNGKSSETTTTTLPSAVTILTLPRNCGGDAATLSATDRAAVSVSQPESIDITGCPTMGVLSGHAASAPYVGDFSATATAGARPIANYLWTFGDGTTATTTAAMIAHTFAPGRPDSATLVAVDTLGARSAVGIAFLGSTTTTGKQVTVTRLAGRTTSGGAPATGSVSLVRCPALTTPINLCRSVASSPLSSGNWSFAIPRPSTPIHYAIVIPGALTVLGSDVRINALPQSSISVSAPTSGVRGHAVAVTGRVSGPAQPGKTVLIQHLVGRNWVTVHSVRLSSTSTYSSSVVLAAGVNHVRVVRPASSTNLASISTVRAITGR